MKNRGFSFFEVIVVSTLILILSEIAYVRYLDYIDNKNIKIAKTMISDIFFTSSRLALKYKQPYKIKFSSSDDKITLLTKLDSKIKSYNLPKGIAYISTESNVFGDFSKYMTSEGNIIKSFSIYIYNRRGIIKHRISFYGFSQTRFLKINNYKKIGRNKLTKYNILEYHDRISEDREEFNKDWSLE